MTEKEQMLYGDIVVLLLEKREEQLKVLKKINELLCQCGYEDEPEIETEVELNTTEVVEVNATAVIEPNEPEAVETIEPCEPCEPCPVCGSCEPCEHQQPCDACDVCEPQPQPQTEGEVNNG